MRFEILNVEHGFAAYAVASDGSVLLFDCGHSPTCQPLEYLSAQGIQTIRRLFITNYDEDHIADLPSVRQRLSIEVLTRNTSLTSTQLRSLKPPPISAAMKVLLEMIDNYTREVSNEQLEPPGVRVRTFHNSYPTFTDTNNLSLLTFLEVGSVFFVLPGDLERAGWLALLTNSEVCQLLARVNVFVASHHGRESGYCQEVFDYCSPSLVVMSDGPVKYDTQRMASTYAQHATGELFNGGSGKHGVEEGCHDSKRWAHFMAVITSTMTESDVEQAALAFLRDLLLPKLISGELRVKDAEHIVEIT